METMEVSFEQVLQLAQRLPVKEQVRLASRLAPVAIAATNQKDAPFTSTLWGALAHLGPAPSADEIDEARREMWRNFPREDV